MPAFDGAFRVCGDTAHYFVAGQANSLCDRMNEADAGRTVADERSTNGDKAVEAVIICPACCAANVARWAGTPTAKGIS